MGSFVEFVYTKHGVGGILQATLGVEDSRILCVGY